MGLRPLAFGLGVPRTLKGSLLTEAMIPGGPRDFLLAQIETGVRMAPPRLIAEWLDGEVSIVDFLFEPNKQFLREYKEQALEVIRSVSAGDIRDACLRGAPHFADIWYSPAAAGRFEGELAIMDHYVREL